MRLHFIAIGGSAMHNLAIAMHSNGHIVTGSDDVIFEPSRQRLLNKGLLPKNLGWSEKNITQDIDVVILGMHAKADNIELIQAKKLGLKIYSYPEFIYEHSKDKTRVVIGGSHGKTTITAMVLHVMNYNDIAIDYLVGAQLEGFDTMVHLTNDNEFILIEGDEYLASALDMRPKFHIYRPNIALLSGIAWDHINVFPTMENYIEQFKIYINKIVDGGILIYNEQDTIVTELVEQTNQPIRKIPYTTPPYSIAEAVVYLDTQDGAMPLEIFGEHNLSNLQGAKWVCQNMGVDEQAFYEAIASFKGASKRLEKIFDNNKTVVYKDFAHSPSKVRASLNAVKELYPNRKVVTCLELHTYSSLNPEFLEQYKGSLDASDVSLVFYSIDAVNTKGLTLMSKEDLALGFGLPNLISFTNSEEFKTYLADLDLDNSVLVFMSSGNYGGLDLNQFLDNIIG